MQPIIVVICHGVETKEIPDNYAQPLLTNITANLTTEERACFFPVSVNYSKKTQYRQTQMFGFCDTYLNKEKLRNIKYTIGGDLIMYQRTKTGTGFATDLHKQIDDLITAQQIKAKDAKIVLLGHSLGTIILYNHFFETKLDIKPCGIFMMGSPFSLYSLPYPTWGGLPNYPIQFMYNFYNTNDWISSKIENVHPCEDIANFCIDYNVRPSFFSLNYWVQNTMLLGGLKAHTFYWENMDVAKIISTKISDLIEEKKL